MSENLALSNAKCLTLDTKVSDHSHHEIQIISDDQYVPRKGEGMFVVARLLFSEIPYIIIKLFCSDILLIITFSPLYS